MWVSGEEDVLVESGYDESRLVGFVSWKWFGDVGRSRTFNGFVKLEMSIM
jgi:hypothetical protein